VPKNGVNKRLTLTAPVSLVMCEVLVGGEHGGAAAVFHRDGEVSAGMA
jgi:hypothetical protein